MSQEHFFLLTLLIINILTLFAMGWDKWKAIHQKWRIPEKSLLLLGLLGGGLGLLVGSRIFRHKTQKMLFKIGIPILLFLNFIEIYFLFF